MKRTHNSKTKSQERKAEIISLFSSDEFLGIEEIAQRIGTSKQYVSRVLHDKNLYPKERNKPVDVSQKIDEICTLSGWSSANLGLVLGVARETITRWRAGDQEASAAIAYRLTILLEGLRHATTQR